MTTPTRFGALCLALALAVLAGAGSAAASSLSEEVPDFDRGQEYVLAQGSLLSPPPTTSTTDAFYGTADGTDTETVELPEGWKHGGVLGDSQHAFVREYEELPAVRKYFDTYALDGHVHSTDSDGLLRKYIREELPAVRKTYSLEDLPSVDSEAVLSKYIREELPAVRKIYEAEKTYSLEDLRSVDSEAVLSKYIREELPAVRHSYEAEDAVLRKHLLLQLPFVRKADSEVSRILERTQPIVTKRTEVVNQPIVKNTYAILPRPVVKPVFKVMPAPVIRRPVTVLPPPVIKNYAKVLPAPVVQRPVTVVPPPVVRKVVNVLPAPVVRKYITPAPVVQAAEQPAAAPVFNKFVKNVFVQRPEEHRERSPVLVVPPREPTKNVYNLIKVTPPTPAAVEVTTTPAPTSPAPTTPTPTTTPAPVVVVAAAKEEAKKEEAKAEEAVEVKTEERKVKSVGKRVVLETVRRVIDVPEFEGPAPPPEHSENTFVDIDGTVRTLESFTQYDQVPVGAASFTSSVKKSSSKSSSSSAQASKSGFAALAAGGPALQALQGTALLDSVSRASTPTPVTSARLLSGSPLMYSAFPSALQQSATATAFPRLGTWDAARFGKSLGEQPAAGEEARESVVFSPTAAVAELADKQKALKQQQQQPVEVLAAERVEAHSPLRTTASVAAAAEPVAASAEPAVPANPAPVPPFPEA